MDTENQILNNDITDEDKEKEIEKERERERERVQEERRAKERAKKRKLIPPFIMLLAGAIVSIAMYISHYELKDMLIVLLCVLIAFYIIGEIYKWMLDRFEAQIEEARMDEGEVIEKEPDESGETGTGTAKQTEDRAEGNS